VLAPILGSAAFFCVAPVVVAGIVPGAIAGWRIGSPFLGLEALRAVGVVLLATSAACLIDCFARFAIQGRGTPAPAAPTSSLIVSGQYRYVRNPMYLAVVAAILGQALLFGSSRVLAYGCIVWCFFHLFVLGYEEPTLRRTFGESYRRYEAGVGRWRPRARPWRRPEVTSTDGVRMGGAPAGGGVGRT
jgi:protein-S-isoprenylcysteine O-methyltransferase Ste14